MEIINPLYDQAFKYLMDNEQIAKKIISIILNSSVVSIQSKPQEIKIWDSVKNIPLSRFDFKAIIKDTDNIQSTVLIEIQKSGNPDPISRFRRYLGKNYLKQETFIVGSGEEEQKHLPIVTIYFLGFPLHEYKNQALLVNNIVHDAYTNETLEKKGKFINLLTHKSYIFQVDNEPTLENTKLSNLLSLFNQKSKSKNRYMLNIDNKSIDGVEDIVDYLHRGTLDSELIEALVSEEEYAESMLSLEAQLQQTTEQKEEERRQKEEAQKQKEEERRQKEEAQKREEEAQKQKEEAMIKLALRMRKYGETVEEIQQETGLSADEINNL